MHENGYGLSPGGSAFERQQIVMHGLEMLTDDKQIMRRQQMVHISHAARDRIIHRDHGQIRIATLYCIKGGFKCSAWQGLYAWVTLRQARSEYAPGAP